MQKRIYNRVKLHTIPVLVALVVGLVGGGSAAYATGQFSGALLKPGTVGEGKLTHPLRAKIDRIDEAASNSAVNALEPRWEEDIDRSIKRLEKQIADEYAKKQP